MNIRKLVCGKNYIAIGMEGSIADLKERQNTCSVCKNTCCQYKKEGINPVEYAEIL